MAQRADAPTIARSDTPGAWSLLRPRWFEVSVAGITVTVTAFLVHQLMAWPPHEDETLALFVGRDSALGSIAQVTRERGGAPLHFALAWLVAHAGLGLGTLRLISAGLAVASLPLVALLGRRLVDPFTGALATALVASSWALLFHGVYARMYSLFLFTSLISLLALLRAIDDGSRGRWALWVAATLLCVAAHPYGALVLGGQIAFLLAAHRNRRRQAAWAVSALVALGLPFWLSDLVLAGRFDVGVGGGGRRLAGPWAIVDYLWRTAGDFSAGWRPVLAAVLALALVGLATGPREARILVLAMTVIPVAAFCVARLGGSASPESRHLIFLLPLLAILTAAGITRLTRRLPAAAAIVVGCLVIAHVSWAWHRTPALFEWEPDARQAARTAAETFLAETSRPDDVLFGYEPLYLGAWERAHDFPDLVLPRADSALALRKLRQHDGALGRGVWVLDASERNNRRPRLEIEERTPKPPGLFRTRRFGPFLVVRTREPMSSARAYLDASWRVMVLGRA